MPRLADDLAEKIAFLQESRSLRERELKELDMFEHVLTAMANDVVNDNVHEAVCKRPEHLLQRIVGPMCAKVLNQFDYPNALIGAARETSLVSVFNLRAAGLSALCDLTDAAMRSIPATKSLRDAVAAADCEDQHASFHESDRAIVEQIDEQVARIIYRYADAFRVGAKTKAAR